MTPNRLHMGLLGSGRVGLDAGPCKGLGDPGPSKGKRFPGREGTPGPRGLQGTPEGPFRSRNISQCVSVNSR